jgi:crotonobetainyl-CoA:carnitine CoA-transferase CaiB-like acyl-CoA transferase
VAHNGMIVGYEHPTAGTIRTLGIPIQFSGTPGDIRRPAPLLGEHTHEVLSEYGAYTGRELAVLQAEGVIYTGGQ